MGVRRGNHQRYHLVEFPPIVLKKPTNGDSTGFEIKTILHLFQIV